MQQVANWDKGIDYIYGTDASTLRELFQAIASTVERQDGVLTWPFGKYQLRVQDAGKLTILGRLTGKIVEDFSRYAYYFQMFFPEGSAEICTYPEPRRLELSFEPKAITKVIGKRKFEEIVELISEMLGKDPVEVDFAKRHEKWYTKCLQWRISN
jgi:hypothetical protein